LISVSHLTDIAADRHEVKITSARSANEFISSSSTGRGA
jgi:hypothetical protein